MGPPASSDTSAPSLRRQAARGTIINSGFEIGLAGLGAAKRIAVAAFLTREEFGVWGIIMATLVTLAWLKNVGISDKYVQQSDDDQEAAFQKAFTLELGVSVAYFVLACGALPLYALAYGHTEIILPGALLALTIVIMAFETPLWIAYRRMQYARQRLLASVDPVISIAATIALSAAGLGYWGLVLGSLAGSAAGAAVCVATSPYRLRLRGDRATARTYLRFSWPLVGLGVSGLVSVQGSLLVANHAVGLAGVGAIGLATSISAFANRVDTIVSQTIYPAVCRVVDRRDRLAEVFVKSNRVALMWALPFGVGLALFAHDLVHYVIGDRWDPAVGLLAAVGLTCAFGQVAFNWALFMRALDRTRPIFTVALLDMGTFLAVSVPGLLLFGLPGYAMGLAAGTAAQIAARTLYMRALFPGFNVVRQIARAVAPTIPATALVLGVRAISGDGRTAAVAAGEVVLFAVAVVVFTFAFERRLVVELAGYLRARAPGPSATVVPGA